MMTALHPRRRTRDGRPSRDCQRRASDRATSAQTLCLGPVARGSSSRRRRDRSCCGCGGNHHHHRGDIADRDRRRSSSPCRYCADERERSRNWPEVRSTVRSSIARWKERLNELLSRRKSFAERRIVSLPHLLNILKKHTG